LAIHGFLGQGVNTVIFRLTPGSSVRAARALFELLNSLLDLSLFFIAGRRF
jgi:hypothetical protein